MQCGKVLSRAGSPEAWSVDRPAGPDTIDRLTGPRARWPILTLKFPPGISYDFSMHLGKVGKPLRGRVGGPTG